MASESVLSDLTSAKRVCTRCGQRIDVCEFCDEPDCRAALCHRCVQIVLFDPVETMRARTSTEAEEKVLAKAADA